MSCKEVKAMEPDEGGRGSSSTAVVATRPVFLASLVNKVNK